MKSKIAKIPKEDRPREKLARLGPGALSDQELMAILIGSGTKGNDVFKVAARIVAKMDGAKNQLTLDDLISIDGVGTAKATLVTAAMEFFRRRIRPEGLKISKATDVEPLLLHYSDRKQEHFITISLNGANEVITTRVVSIGLVNTTQVHPREVYADPITDRASSIIVAHNHPSGMLEPSKEDIAVTQKLKQAGEILGIKLLDHIIFSSKGLYSFLDHGLL